MKLTEEQLFTIADSISADFVFYVSPDTGELDKSDSLIIFASRDEKWLEKEIIGNERSSVDNFL